MGVPVPTLEQLIVSVGGSAGTSLVAAGRLDPSYAGSELAKAAATNAQAAAQVLLAAAAIDVVTTGRVLVAAAKSAPFATSMAVVEAARLDARASGTMLAFASVIDARSIAALVVNASKIDARVAGQLVAETANASPEATGRLLVEAARIDAQATGKAIGWGTLADATPTNQAVVIAGKIDVGAIQAALGAGIASVPGALAALGTGIPVETFVPENAPMEGVDPTTGEVWQPAGSPQPVERILAKFSRPIQDAYVDVAEVPALPAGVPALPTDQVVKEFVRFTARNFDEADLRAAHVTFFVEKSWLEANDIHPWSVRFNRYDEERRTWVAFVGKLVREDELRVYYTVTPPGFSLWAISGSSSGPPVQFRVDDLSIDPIGIRERQHVTVQAQVTNLGTTTGDHNVTLWLNGRVHASQTVEVPPETTVAVSFILEPREGAYAVRVDRLSGSLRVSAAPPPPTSSTELVFGPLSTERTVTVANPADGTPLEYIITTDQVWLSANPARFNLGPGASQPVTLSVDRTGLEIGSYSGQVIISFTGLISGSAVITVSMEVAEPPSPPGVSPIITPTLDLGPRGISGTTIVANPPGGSPLLYTVTTHHPWLVATPSSFVLAPGASQALTLSVDREGLEIGPHTGLVTIAYSGAISGSSVITVELEVPPPPPPPLIAPVVSPRLDLGTRGTSGTITVTSPSVGGSLQYTVTTNQPWLKASHASFVLEPGASQAITLSVDRKGLGVGRHTAHVTITFSGALSGTSVLPVSVDVAAPPIFTPRLDLGVTGKSVTITVDNPNETDPLQYAVVADQPWLTASPATFVLASGGSQIVTLSASREGLTPGHHITEVTIAFSGALSGSSAVTVSLEVPPPAPLAVIVPVVSPGVDLGATRTSGTITVATPPDGGSLEYTVTIDQPWLTATLTSFVLTAGDSQTVTLSVDRKGLQAGRHKAEVTIAFSGATSGSSLVPVSVEVAEPEVTGPIPWGGFDIWSLVIIGFGGTALLWIVISQASRRRLRGTVGPTYLQVGAPFSTSQKFSLVIIAAMFVIASLDAAGNGLGLNFVAAVAIAIGAVVVIVLTLIRGAGSGRIRRAELAARGLDRDRV